MIVETNQYREKLQRVDWDELINSGNSLDDLCESFSNVILQAAGESIPNKIITVRNSNNSVQNNHHPPPPSKLF